MKMKLIGNHEFILLGIAFYIDHHEHDKTMCNNDI